MRSRLFLLQTRCLISTIVEIFYAFQTDAREMNRCTNLQQQKSFMRSRLLRCLYQHRIYNSRNLLCVLDCLQSKKTIEKSTIVEIFYAFQTCRINYKRRSKSTIVEIFYAFQTEREQNPVSIFIYNSRNLLCVLDSILDQEEYFGSTIVEIFYAFQTYTRQYYKDMTIYNSRNLLCVLDCLRL